MSRADTEQAVLILADMFGPRRAACATLLELEGTPNADSTAALTTVAASFGTQSGDAAARILAAHDRATLGVDAEDALFQTLALTMRISRRAELLR
jgi:hypothetical protein